MDTTDDAALEISRWTRPGQLRTLDDVLRIAKAHPLYKTYMRELRLRKIERFRYRQWLASFNVEPGKVPYGVAS